MGFLVKEAAERAEVLRERIQSRSK
jgi:hypothetical protein